MNAHTFTFTHEFERDGNSLEIEVTYSATPGRPEQGPTYACGGQPAEPGEVEIVSITDGEWDITDAFTDAEEAAILAVCEARLDQDWLEYQADEAEYRADQLRDRKWEDEA